MAGCVPQGAPKADFLHGLSIVGVQQIDRIVEVVEETLKGNSYSLYLSLWIRGGGDACPEYIIYIWGERSKIIFEKKNEINKTEFDKNNIQFEPKL